MAGMWAAGIRVAITIPMLMATPGAAQWQRTRAKVQEVATDKWIWLWNMASPHGERAAAGHLGLLFDVAMRALLLLLLPVEIDRGNPLQGLVADHIPIRDGLHVPNDIGAAET